MLDGKDDTCWNSAQAPQQHIIVKFKKPVDLSEVHIMFQGGFVGTPVQFHVQHAVKGGDDSKDAEESEDSTRKKSKVPFELKETYEPTDSNNKQVKMFSIVWFLP